MIARLSSLPAVKLLLLALYLAFVAGWGAPGLWWGLLTGLALVAGALLFRFLAVVRGVVARV